MSRAQFDQGELRNDLGLYKSSPSYFYKALEYLPVKSAGLVCRGDLFRIYRGLGKGFYEKKRAGMGGLDAYAAMTLSREYYIKAAALNPGDIYTAEGLALATADLEFRHERLFPDKENPYDALPLFKRAMHIGPNDVPVHLEAARYMKKKQAFLLLADTIRHLVKVYPPEYGIVIKEFSSVPGIRGAVKAGLEAAVEKDIRKIQACYGLSAIFEKEGACAPAAEYYGQAMALENRVRHDSYRYLKLAGLYLNCGEKLKAYSALADSLKNSRTPLKTIQHICTLFHRQSLYDQFLEFAGTIERRQMLFPDLEICLARTRIKMDQPDAARQILDGLNSRRPSHEAFYMLAMMAQKEKDWDAMELAIQRATVLEPGNSRYYSLFIKSLCAQGKYKAAEYQAGRAIEAAQQPSASLYNTRAGLRCRIEDFKGAADDWKKALALDPENKTYQNMLKKLNAS